MTRIIKELFTGIKKENTKLTKFIENLEILKISNDNSEKEISEKSNNDIEN